MAKALYFLAAVTAFVFAAPVIAGMIIVVSTRASSLTGYDLFVLIQPSALIAAGIIFLRKHRREPDRDVAFDKPAVLSVGGIGCFVGGIVWFASEIRLVVDILHMYNRIEISVIERLLAPVVLTALGAYFGFVHPRKAQFASHVAG